jgi:hypothetical protein
MDDRINPEGGRQVLRYRGDELAFDMWVALFRDNLPDSIRQVQERKRRAHEAKFDSETLSNDLKRFYPELIVLGGVRNLSGNANSGLKGSRPFISEGQTPGGGGGGGPEGESTPSKPKIADIIQQITPSLNKIRAKHAAAKFPGCQWLSDNPDQYLNTDQKPEDYLINKAALYDHYENMVRCNWDFFLDRYEMLRAEYQDFMAAYGEEKVSAIIQTEIQNFYAHILSDTVVAMLIKREDWEARDFQTAVGEVGLTAVAVGRSRIEEISYAISKRLENEFGMDQKMKEVKRQRRRRKQIATTAN